MFSMYLEIIIKGAITSFSMVVVHTFKLQSLAGPLYLFYFMRINTKANSFLILILVLSLNTEGVCVWRHDAGYITDVNTARFTWRENRQWHRCWSVLSVPGKVTVSGRKPGSGEENWWLPRSPWRAVWPTNCPEKSATTASHGETLWMWQAVLWTGNMLKSKQRILRIALVYISSGYKDSLLAWVCPLWKESMLSSRLTQLVWCSHFLFSVSWCVCSLFVLLCAYDYSWCHVSCLHQLNIYSS